jgi:hypothetical protein
MRCCRIGCCPLQLHNMHVMTTGLQLRLTSRNTVPTAARSSALIPCPRPSGGSGGRCSGSPAPPPGTQGGRARRYISGGAPGGAAALERIFSIEQQLRPKRACSCARFWAALEHHTQQQASHMLHRQGKATKQGCTCTVPTSIGNPAQAQVLPAMQLPRAAAGHPEVHNRTKLPWPESFP